MGPHSRPIYSLTFWLIMLDEISLLLVHVRCHDAQRWVLPETYGVFSSLQRRLCSEVDTELHSRNLAAVPATCLFLS